MKNLLQIMKFDLCKFGIHDYEDYNDKDEIKDIIQEHLETKGFTYIPISKENWPHFTNDHYRIYCYGFFGDEGCIDSCYPSSPTTKVCLKCGKIKTNWNIDVVLKNVDHVVQEKEYYLFRHNKGIEIIKNS